MSNRLGELPSLDLLRSFAAVARRMSVTEAAADLFLTQPAVSRQLHALEADLGMPLFHRRHRALELTAEGERLFRLVDPWLDQLADHVAALRERQRSPALTITSTIGITGLWLLPRLGEFQAAHPDVDVRVSAGNRLVDLQRDGVDLALRYCPPALVPRGAQALFEERIVPVASPSLGLASDFEANDIGRLTLLEYDELAAGWLCWPDWLKAMGLARERPRARIAFNQYDQLIFAALAGQGVALGRAPLVADFVAAGRLVPLRVASAPVQPDYAYWLVERAGGESQARADFVRWLRAEAAKTRSLYTSSV